MPGICWVQNSMAIWRRWVYDLYCKMLSEAVKEAKGQVVMDDFETTIDLDIDAFIPDSYIGNEFQKLDIYKRIAGIENEEEYGDILRAKGMVKGEDGTWIYFDMVPEELRSVRVHRNIQAVCA